VFAKTKLPAALARLLPWAPLVTWSYLGACRGRYWEVLDSLPAAPEPSSWPCACIVVPARNEAALLPHTLPTLLGQDYPGKASVVLVDDESTDATADIARAMAGHGGLELKVVTGTARPRGWAGKPWALAQGVEHAMSGPEPPEWLLFTDADIAHPSNCLRRLVAAATGADKAAVSLMARLCTQTFWERLAMPAFVYFFAQIYPYSWVNDPSRRTAAAAGGCLLVRADSLRAAGGLERVRAATIDDIAIAKAVKSTGYDIWLGAAGDGTASKAPAVRSLRSWPGLAGVWDMVARNAYTQLGRKPAALAGALGGLFCAYLAPPLLASTGVALRRPRLALAGLAAWTTMAATYLPTIRYYRLRPAAALAMPFTALLYAGMTLASARRHYKGTSTWKGRPA
jgi:hopene-associated glycosyltransferase HpnB